jgi:hypothetical protein
VTQGSLKDANEQLGNQVGDLAKQVSDLSAREADLKSQIILLGHMIIGTPANALMYRVPDP